MRAHPGRLVSLDVKAVEPRVKLTKCAERVAAPGTLPRELADAERQREVEYDGQLLVDAIVPLGMPPCIRVCMCICARV